MCELVLYAWRWLAVAGVAVGAAADLSNPDLDDLRLLPIDKLIAIKHALRPESELVQEVTTNTSDPQGAGALPLRGDPGRGRPPNRRGGGGGWGGHSEPPVWIEEVEVPSWKKGGGKGKGLDAIFQGTVTVLAFLAFGGYLICLLVHTLKEKKAALTMTMVNVSGTAVEATRRRRSWRSAPPSTDVYLAMRHLAEGYARYNHHCLDHPGP